MARNDRKRAAPTPATVRVRRSASARVTRPRSVRPVSDDDSSARGTGSSTRNASRDRAGSRAMPRKKMAGVRPRKYRVVFERDETGAWIARVPSVRGCHTYGRTLEQVRNRIREALALWVGDADEAELVEEIRLPARVHKQIRASKEQRDEVETSRRRAQSSTV